MAQDVTNSNPTAQTSPDQPNPDGIRPDQSNAGRNAPLTQKADGQRQEKPSQDDRAVVFACPVELSTKAQGRQRELCASIEIPCAVDPVWRILTNYDRLADIVPNLTVSRRLPHPEGEHKVRLEQVASQTILKKVDFSARVVLDMEEDYPHKIHFAMVEGDFKMMKGHWMLESLEVEGKAHTRLSYCLVILPKLTMPIQLVEKCLHKDLKTNLEAIYRVAILRSLAEPIATQFSDDALSPI